MLPGLSLWNLGLGELVAVALGTQTCAQCVQPPIVWCTLNMYGGVGIAIPGLSFWKLGLG